MAASPASAAHRPDDDKMLEYYGFNDRKEDYDDKNGPEVFNGGDDKEAIRETDKEWRNTVGRSDAWRAGLSGLGSL